jgi:hypothetical protein
LPSLFKRAKGNLRRLVVRNSSSPSRSPSPLPRKHFHLPIVSSLNSTLFFSKELVTFRHYGTPSHV